MLNNKILNLSTKTLTLEVVDRIDIFITFYKKLILFILLYTFNSSYFLCCTYMANETNI